MTNHVVVQDYLRVIYQEFFYCGFTNEDELQLLRSKYGKLHLCWGFESKLDQWTDSCFKTFSFPLNNLVTSGNMIVDSLVKSCLFNDVRIAFYVLTCIVSLTTRVEDSVKFKAIEELQAACNTLFSTYKMIKDNCVCDTQFTTVGRCVLLQITGSHHCN